MGGFLFSGNILEFDKMTKVLDLNGENDYTWLNAIKLYSSK
jgi:hypothetical protein